jgi:hypothetical protein
MLSLCLFLTLTVPKKFIKENQSRFLLDLYRPKGKNLMLQAFERERPALTVLILSDYSGDVEEGMMPSEPYGEMRQAAGGTGPCA